MEQQFFVRTQQKFLTSAKPFETEGPGATWADIMIKWKLLVIGSVYINVGKIGEIEILEQVVQKMHAKHKHMIICLDVNSRDPIWDPSSLNMKSHVMSRKMGEKMATSTLNHSMGIHNNRQ